MVGGGDDFVYLKPFTSGVLIVIVFRRDDNLSSIEKCRHQMEVKHEGRHS